MYTASSSRRLIVFTLCVIVLFVAQVAGANSDRVASRLKSLSADLHKVARGLETGIVKDDVKVAVSLYALEARAADLLQYSASTTFKKGTDKRGAVSDVRAVYRRVLRLQERMLDHTLSELDRALPGEPNREMWAREGVDLYRPLLREGTPDPNAPKASKEVRNRIFKGMQRSFVEEGGTSKDFTTLGPKFLKSVKSGELVEWVQRGSKIHLNAAGAKHPVIASGVNENEIPHSVRGAGSLKVYKDASNRIVMVVVSNSSGNYKPGIGSVEGVVSKLVGEGVSDRRIEVTRVLPGEPVLVKLLLKSKKQLTKEQIKSSINAIRLDVHNDIKRRNTLVKTKDMLAKARPSVKPRAKPMKARTYKAQKQSKKRTAARQAKVRR